MKEKRLRPILRCRFNKVVPLDRFVWASYQHEKADFVDLLPDDYMAAFDPDFTKKLDAVEKLVRRVQTGKEEATGKQAPAYFCGH